MAIASPPSGALFDPTQTYRYCLWRIWHGSAPKLAVIMLNPSTADAQHNDPTIRRCIGLATAWGYGALMVVNLFAYRTTQPTGLKRTADPVGQDNDRHLHEAADWADTLVVAWGNWGSLYGRDQAVLKWLASERSLYCLGTNQTGQPRHPLYVNSGTIPIPFQPRQDAAANSV